MEAKVCRQCGELKPLSQYRKYYGGRTGHYTTCKQCEKINSRLKYLESKETLTEVERIERDKILKLYDAQRGAGLRPPSRGGRRAEAVTGLDALDAMIDEYEARKRVEYPYAVIASNPVPLELSKWLTCELTLEPDEYIDEVYEQLCKTYRPVVKIDQATMMPVYDDTYKNTLDAILNRFYEYEATYYGEE